MVQVVLNKPESSVDMEQLKDDILQKVMMFDFKGKIMITLVSVFLCL